MLKKNATNSYTASQVCNELCISVKTLNDWYKWYLDDSFEKPKDIPELPMYEQANVKGRRFWTKEQIKQLKVFQKWLPRGRNGVMGRYSERYWTAYNKNKETTSNGK